MDASTLKQLIDSEAITEPYEVPLYLAEDTDLKLLLETLNDAKDGLDFEWLLPIMYYAAMHDKNALLLFFKSITDGDTHTHISNHLIDSPKDLTGVALKEVVAALYSQALDATVMPRAKAFFDYHKNVIVPANTLAPFSDQFIGIGYQDNGLRSPERSTSTAQSLLDVLKADYARFIQSPSAIIVPGEDGYIYRYHRVHDMGGHSIEPVVFARDGYIPYAEFSHLFDNYTKAAQRQASSIANIRVGVCVGYYIDKQGKRLYMVNVEVRLYYKRGIHYTTRETVKNEYQPIIVAEVLKRLNMSAEKFEVLVPADSSIIQLRRHTCVKDYIIVEGAKILAKAEEVK